MAKPWKATLLCGLLAILLLTVLVQRATFAGTTFGREQLKGSTPSNTNPIPRPNIGAARQLTAQAYDKLMAASRANEWDATGHAQRAAALLEQVNQELKLAEAAPPNK